jgi:DNA-binding transcriptional MerR regulator
MKKLYYTIGEVSEIVNEEKYVLRYWENEFPTLHPKKNSAGNRSYTERDIAVIKQIQSLLRDQQMRLKDAKDILPTLEFEEPTPIVEESSTEPENIPQIQAAKPAIIFNEKSQGMLMQEKVELDESTKEELLSLLKDIKTFIELEY